MMRPEFALHLLAIIPSKKDVQNSYAEIFPSILGVKLGNRIDEETLKTFIKKTKQTFEMDESRAKVVLATKAAELQSDFKKEYEQYD